MHYTVPGLSMQAIFLKAVDLGQLSVQVETFHSDERTSVPRILVHSHKLTRQKFWERKIVLANGISQDKLEFAKSLGNSEKIFEKMENSLETANNLETAKLSGKCETLSSSSF